jgi:hypothetical protein
MFDMSFDIQPVSLSQNQRLHPLNHRYIKEGILEGIILTIDFQINMKKS